MPPASAYREERREWSGGCRPGRHRPLAVRSRRWSLIGTDGPPTPARGVGGAPGAQPPQGRVEVRTEFGARCRGGGRKRPHDQRTALRKGSEPRRHEVSQPPDHPVSYDGVPDGLAHHEPGPGVGAVPGQQVHDHTAAPGTDAAPHHGTELITAPQASVGRKHAAPRRRRPRSPVRRRAADGPCVDGLPGWPGLPAYASAAGTRGSARVGGCSAGRCACPCSRLSFSWSQASGLGVRRRVRTPAGRVARARRVENRAGRTAPLSAVDLLRVRVRPPHADTDPRPHDSRGPFGHALHLSVLPDVTRPRASVTPSRAFGWQGTVTRATLTAEHAL